MSDITLFTVITVVTWTPLSLRLSLSLSKVHINPHYSQNQLSIKSRLKLNWPIPPPPPHKFHKNYVNGKPLPHTPYIYTLAHVFFFNYTYAPSPHKNCTDIFKLLIISQLLPKLIENVQKALQVFKIMLKPLHSDRNYRINPTLRQMTKRPSRLIKITIYSLKWSQHKFMHKTLYLYVYLCMMLDLVFERI